jgi:Tfp pilus assembly protein FimT
MLVMALLSIVLSVSLPSWSSFFRGRTLDSEARRLLALTRSGQSRAVSEGVPMVLWLDVDARVYGLKEEPGWVDTDPKAVEFTLDSDLKMEVIHSNTDKAAAALNKPQSNALVDQHSNLPKMRFQPDGSIDETSVSAVRISDRSTSLWLAKSRNLLNYEIRSQFN